MRGARFDSGMPPHFLVDSDFPMWETLGMRVYGYLRVSSKGQIDGDGLPRQREAIRQFCELHKLNYCGEFAEKGVPGKTEASNRPAWLDMMDCVKNRRDNGSEMIDAVIVERMDRLARDLIVSELLLTELRKRKVKLFVTDRGLIDVASNDVDPAQKMIRQIIAAVAEFSKSELVMKLRLARERAARSRGEEYSCGHTPYGELPGESGIRQIILNQRAAGKSIRQIAAFLNAEEVLNRNKLPFGPSLVWQICKTAEKREQRKQQQSCGISTPSNL